MNSLMDLVWRLPAAIAWTRACQLSADQDHQKALEIIDDLPLRERRKIAWRLLRLQQHFFLKDDQTVTEEVPNLMKDIRDAKRLAPDIKRYLGTYLRWLWSYDEGGAPVRPDGSFLVENARFEEIDLSKIPRFWKEAFPLRSHPSWPVKE